MKLKGAIFDLDGTLLDSMPVWDNIANSFLMSKNHVPHEHFLDIIRDMNLMESARYIIEKYSLTESEDELIHEFSEFLAKQYRESIPMKPTAEAFLKRLKQSGVKMYIATATDRHIMLPALERLGILDYFQGIITCGEIGIGKEKPDIYFHALEQLQTPIDETVIFEDALYAIKTAKRAGFIVAGIYDKSASADYEQIRAEVDYYLNSYDDWEMI